MAAGSRRLGASGGMGGGYEEACAAGELREPPGGFVERVFGGRSGVARGLSGVYVANLLMSLICYDPLDPPSRPSPVTPSPSLGSERVTLA